ncbi:sushi domain-containing protein 2-like [Apostichopus japonicus]|uniref:sushi domain-containing protein 2-like n=1 Tax=Stichopus japonicus TaxID=307972 RepID=UPI003AB71BCD
MDSCYLFRFYIAGRFAVCSGDPHMLTLDGNLYTFNGWGEFLMIIVGDGDVMLQAISLPIAIGVGQGTVIKAVAACVKGSDGLQVEVATGGDLIA